MRIIDNFLPSYQYKQLRDIMTGGFFPWFWNDSVIDKYHEKRWLFFHMFYHDTETSPDGGPLRSSYLPIMDPLVNQLGIKNLRRIKANLQIKTLFHDRTGYHIDYESCKTENEMMTAVYYLNTNNGWTDIKGHGKIKSVANRMVVFPGSLEHRGVSCTDQRKRVVINFNYKK